LKFFFRALFRVQKAKERNASARERNSFNKDVDYSVMRLISIWHAKCWDSIVFTAIPRELHTCRRYVYLFVMSMPPSGFRRGFRRFRTRNGVAWPASRRSRKFRALVSSNHVTPDNSLKRSHRKCSRNFPTPPWTQSPPT